MPATLQQHLSPGARVSRYELREVLGGGGFGITYRAWDSRLHRDVAIKEFLPKDLALREPGAAAVLALTMAVGPMIKAEAGAVGR